MSIVHRYRPAYCEGFPHEEAFANNLKEFLEIPWIKLWSEDEGFYKYSQCKDYSHMIMAEFNNGYKWYVIAATDKPLFYLPVWEAAYENSSK